jgi:hypothetical protein
MANTQLNNLSGSAALALISTSAARVVKRPLELRTNAKLKRVVTRKND